jgi:hypothetical protein
LPAAMAFLRPRFIRAGVYSARAVLMAVRDTPFREPVHVSRVGAYAMGLG